FVAAPASHPLPGGESGADAVHRAGQVLIELAESGGSVLVVAHTTLGRLLLCHILGLQLDGYRRAFPSVGNGTVTTFDLPRNVATVDDLAGCAALIRFNSEIH
ncbi:histidine phosphatase family protein, partial [Agreia sp.]|uniref:histidine phosphatase family protein n=1 Tax=Agreia sp. TaxID=1872416 RepID=UPI0035BC35C8